MEPFELLKRIELASVDNNLQELLRQEILERKHIEAKLRESEERYRSLVQLSPDGILVVQEDKVVFCNQEAAKIFGYESYRELLGLNVDEFVDADYKALIKKRRESLLNQEKQPPLELKSVRVDGKTIFIDIKSSFLYFQHKPAVQVVFRDISQRKKYEEELRNVDRLNLLGKMAASFAHEMRNPLTTIRGFLQILLRKEECSNYEQHFSLMITELDRVNSIITEFLSLGRNKTAKVEILDLNEIITAILPLIESDAVQASNYVKLELGKIPKILLDKQEIIQLIFNLARNGIEAMQPGGVLTLKTYGEKDKVVLVIKDQGPGIDPKMLGKLGTPFVSTKEGGTGLGLSICYSIIAKHDAELEVESNNKGTTFLIFFKKV